MAYYYVNCGGKNLGPYSSEQVVSLLRERRLSLDDLGVEEGAEDWQPLGDIVDPAVLAVPSPPTRKLPTWPTPLYRFDPNNVHFSSNGISVTNTRVVIGAQTFAVENISSVVVERHDPPTLLPGLLIVAGACIAIFAIGASAAGAIVFGIVLVLLGIAVLQIGKSTYWLVLTTAGGEVRACSSRNQADAQRIVVAINRAIIERAYPRSPS